MMAPDTFQVLQSRIEHTFRNPQLLQQALTHSSILKDVSRVPDNQRLEFLGDAVLDLVLAEALFVKFPGMDEGSLSKARANLATNNSSLAGVARSLGLGEAIVMSHGEETSGGRDRDSILADAYEALVGAIYHDSGFEAARAFVLRCFRESLEASGKPQLIPNPKGDLQELLQSGEATPVVYRLESSSGPDHSKHFECSVHFGEVELGRGAGNSKQAAEKNAATAALEAIKRREHPGLVPTRPSEKKKGGG